MATTTYVVLRETEPSDNSVYYVVADAVEAPNAAAARRKIAEAMSESDLDGGVTLIAVPARNWKTGRGTLKAETQRRIRPA